MLPYLPSVPVFRIDQNQEIPIILRRCQEEMMSELRLPGCKSSFFKCNRASTSTEMCAEKCKVFKVQKFTTLDVLQQTNQFSTCPALKEF